MKDKILIIDIETTGFLNANGKIVEIGIVELNIVTGETKILFDSCTHETGVTREELQKSWIIENSDMTILEIQHSPNLEKIREKVQKILDRYTLGCTAFNNKFDFDFMESRGFSFPRKLDCPMKILTPILQIPKGTGRGGYKWPSVTEAVKLIFKELDFVEEHRGAADALVEARIVYELFKEGHFIV